MGQQEFEEYYRRRGCGQGRHSLVVSCRRTWRSLWLARRCVIRCTDCRLALPEPHLRDHRHWPSQQGIMARPGAQ